MVDAQTFFRTHPVFTLGRFRTLVGGKATPATTRTRLKYHLGRGHLKLVERGVYAVVPPGVQRRQFVPDRFLVAAALREDAVLAYHGALELLGFAYSTYRDTLYLTARRRKDLTLAGGRVRALLHPRPLRDKGAEHYGVETRERLGVKLKVTGPERTLVDCLMAPRYAGGIEEVLQSTGALPTVDLDRLWGYLQRLDQRRGFALVGFVLEREAERLFVPREFLDRLARMRPSSPTYLEHGGRGGRLQTRWNLIVPDAGRREGRSRYSREDLERRRVPRDAAGARPYAAAPPLHRAPWGSAAGADRIREPTDGGIHAGPARARRTAPRTRRGLTSPSSSRACAATRHCCGRPSAGQVCVPAANPLGASGRVAGGRVGPGGQERDFTAKRDSAPRTFGKRKT